MVATATRCGSLYFLNCKSNEQANAVETKEDVWHKRYGHLGVQSLNRLAVDRMVDGFDYGGSKEMSLFEPCTKGKHHKSPFPVGGGTGAK